MTILLKKFCDIHVELGVPIEMGLAPKGKRRIIPIVGGTFEGPDIRGRVVNLGADWQTILPEQVAELDTRYCLETDDGAWIEIRNFGFRHGPPEVLAAIARGETVDPASYYMRTHCRFETGAPRYDWLNRTLFLGTGRRDAAAVRIEIFEIC